MIETIITILILIMFSLFMIMWILAVAWWVKPFKVLTWFCHDFLGWHKPNGTYIYDGIVDRSNCKICGKEIFRSSQGNWLTFD